MKTIQRIATAFTDPVAPLELPHFHLDLRGQSGARLEGGVDRHFGVQFELSPRGAVAARRGVSQCDGYMLGGMAVLVRTMGAHGVVRDERHLRASQIDHYCLRVPLASDPAGTGVSDVPLLADMARVIRFDLPAGSDVLIFVPRHALDVLLPRKLYLHGAQLRGPSGVLLANFARALASRVKAVRAGEAAALTKATLHLMAAALAPQGDSLPLAQPRTDQVLLREVQRFIDEHMSDPGLSPAHLCDAFALSRSSLFRLLGPLGGPATCIRERRLTRAHAMLSGASRRVYLKRAAMDCGFTDASHFSRAFRSKYGYSPSEALVHGPQAVAAARGLQQQRAGAAANDNPFTSWLQALCAG